MFCYHGSQVSFAVFQKNLFVLGFFEFLAMLEGKVRKGSFFWGINLVKNNVKRMLLQK
jgi:hypothetical protein